MCASTSLAISSSSQSSSIKDLPKNKIQTLPVTVLFYLIDWLNDSDLAQFIGTNKWLSTLSIFQSVPKAIKIGHEGNKTKIYRQEKTIVNFISLIRKRSLLKFETFEKYRIVKEIAISKLGRDPELAERISEIYESSYSFINSKVGLPITFPQEWFPKLRRISCSFSQALSYHFFSNFANLSELHLHHIYTPTNNPLRIPSEFISALNKRNIKIAFYENFLYKSPHLTVSNWLEFSPHMQQLHEIQGLKHLDWEINLDYINPMVVMNAFTQLESLSLRGVAFSEQHEFSLLSLTNLRSLKLISCGNIKIPLANLIKLPKCTELTIFYNIETREPNFELIGHKFKNSIKTDLKHIEKLTLKCRIVFPLFRKFLTSYQTFENLKDLTLIIDSFNMRTTKILLNHPHLKVLSITNKEFNTLEEKLTTQLKEFTKNLAKHNGKTVCFQKYDLTPTKEFPYSIERPNF